jgi:hypothetical protein
MAPLEMTGYGDMTGHGLAIGFLLLLWVILYRSPGVNSLWA